MSVASILVIGLLLGCIWLLVRVANKLDTVQPKEPIYHIHVTGGQSTAEPQQKAKATKPKSEISIDQFKKSSNNTEDSWLNKKIEDSNL